MTTYRPQVWFSWEPRRLRNHEWCGTKIFPTEKEAHQCLLEIIERRMTEVGGARVEKTDLSYTHRWINGGAVPRSQIWRYEKDPNYRPNSH